jgi:hypothetical protein
LKTFRAIALAGAEVVVEWSEETLEKINLDQKVELAK